MLKCPKDVVRGCAPEGPALQWRLNFQFPTPRVGYWLGREDKKRFGTDAHGAAMETGPTLAVMPNFVHKDWIVSAPSTEGRKRYQGLYPGRKGAHPGKVHGFYVPSPGLLDDFFKKGGRSLGHRGRPNE
jgi:hypothetical protein